MHNFFQGGVQAALRCVSEWRAWGLQSEALLVVAIVANVDGEKNRNDSDISGPCHHALVT